MFVVALITCPNIKEAQNISRALVKARLAACVNIIGGIQSVFWWQKKIDTAKEILLIVKTKKSLFKKLALKVKSMHSYKVPEIISLPIIDGNKEYLGWLK